MKYAKIENVLINLFIAILFCGLLPACGVQTNQTINENLFPENERPKYISDIEDYVASYPIKITSRTSEDEITNMLFDLWLEHFTDKSVGDQIRLNNYEIHEVILPPVFQICKSESPDVLFIAEITYSVQPNSNPSPDWIAGTGTIGEDNWIHDKLTYASVSKIDEMYSLQILGIPPCTDTQ